MEEAEEILQLQARVIHSKDNINDLEVGVTTLLELKETLAKLDRMGEEPVAPIDIDAQVRLFKRQIHIYESRIRKYEDRIERITTKDIIKSERYENDMPELKLRKREITKEIQKIELAIDYLRKTAECFKRIHTQFEDVITDSNIERQIKLLEKENLNNVSPLQEIEKKIIDLEAQETQYVVSLANGQPVNQLFFAASAEKCNGIKTPEPELKNLSL